MPVFTGANSVFQNGNAFIGLGSDKLTVNRDGYLISKDEDGAAMLQNWTVTANGSIGTFGAGKYGVNLISNGNGFSSSVTVGADAEIFGGGGIVTGHATKIVNKGTISSFADGVFAVNYTNDAFGDYSLTNSGLIFGFEGGITLGGIGNHVVTNTGTINAPFAITADNMFGTDKVTNSGSIFGMIDLSGGDDTLTNSGTIFGPINLNTGNDTFKNTGNLIESLVDLGSGNDAFIGGAKSETVVDNQGVDKYSFGGGDDLFLAYYNDTNTVDQVDGGAGNDFYDLTDVAFATIVSFDTVLRSEYLNGFAIGQGYIIPAKQAAVFDGTTDTDTVTNFESFRGGTKLDVVFGSTAANSLSGEAGDDDLWGLGGKDTLDGGSGTDTLVGGANRDRLVGGNDADTFVYGAAADSGVSATTRDVIVDFDTDVDRINLQPMDADSKMAGDQAFDLIDVHGGLGAFTKVAGQLHYRFAGTNTIIEGDTNGDGKADFAIEMLGQHLLSDTQFIL